MRFSDRVWRVAPPVTADLVARFPELPPLLVQLLANRGLTDQAAVDEFRNPDWGQDIHDPFAFRDMRRAVERLARALEQKEKIAIYGDYDADGVTAAALLTQTFRVLGQEPVVYLPDRQTEGYGLHTAALERLARDGAKVLVTVDCGSSNLTEIAEAAKLGLDVIVTDHHAEPPERPKPFALLNPSFTDETYPFRSLSAGGVAYKLAQALLTHVEYGTALERPAVPAGWEKWLLDYVALSTVADMVPLVGENRTLVRYGLTVLSKSRHPGVRALLKAARVNPAQVSEDDVAFVLAPRINAAGRMHHASAAFRLLVTEDATEAERLAGELTKTNIERQRRTAQVFEACREQIGERPAQPAVFAGDPAWPAGLLGLVAGKLVQHYGVPAVVYGGLNGQLVASGRSVPGLDIMAVLAATRPFLAKAGGHAQACGFTLTESEVRPAFEQAFADSITQQLAGARPTPLLEIDALWPVERVDWSTVDLLESLRPFGVGNRRPRFVAQDVEIVSLERVGGEQKHLKLVVTGGDGVMRKMIGFTFGHHGAALKPGERLNVVYEVGARTWNGNREIELKMIDAKHTHES